MKVFDARKLVTDPELADSLRMVRPLVLMMGKAWEVEAHGKSLDEIQASGTAYDEDWLSDSVEPLSWAEYVELLKAV